VDDSPLVRERERPRDLEPDLDNLLDRQRAGALHELLEILPLDVLEDDELALVVLAAVDHGDDVRVRELGDRPGLPAEALEVLGVLAVALVEDLQRDLALEQAVVRAVDRRHSAAADELLELVAARDHLPGHREGRLPRCFDARPRWRTRARPPRPRALRRARGR
jgi:hypothetical protein